MGGLGWGVYRAQLQYPNWLAVSNSHWAVGFNTEPMKGTWPNPCYPCAHWREGTGDVGPSASVWP